MDYKELDKKEIGARIRARRESLGMTREDLGRMLDVTGKFVADIEYGEKGVSNKTLYKLKQILGVSTDYILDGIADNFPDDDTRRLLSENIIGSLSVCSVEQLGCMEQIARLYIEGIVNKG